MPVTKLDPTSALVVIDLQTGIVGIPTVHPPAEIVVRSAQLGENAHHGRVVPLTNAFAF